MKTGRTSLLSRLQLTGRRARRPVVIPTVLAAVLAGPPSPGSRRPPGQPRSPGPACGAGWTAVPLRRARPGSRAAPHEVPASADLARGGHGLPPHRGHGQLPPFRPHRPAPRRSVTGPDISGAAHGFSLRTSTPVMSRATATSTLYRNSGGSYTRIVSTQPVNYRAAGGSWRPINTTLRRGGPGGRLRETASAMQVSLAARAGGTDLVSVAPVAARRPVAAVTANDLC